MVACGNITVDELQNSRKDVTRDKNKFGIKKTPRGMSYPYPKVKRVEKGLEMKCLRNET